MTTPAPDMSPIRVPNNLPELVKAAFNKARVGRDLTYYPTEVALLHINSIPFQLRFSPSLANKPKAPQPNPATANRTPFDPFDNPEGALLVAPIPPHHNLVLNKFAIVPEHSILATVEFRPQTHLLEATDLAAARACIEAYPADKDGRGDLFAFFNSGPHSGASQPHRHLQLLPVERMRDGLGDRESAPWGVLAETLLGRDGDGDVAARLPFRTFTGQITEDMEPQELHDIYLGLYRNACRTAGGVNVDGDDVEGEAKISYNLAMTRHTIVLCPRTAEGSAVFGPTGGSVGKLSLNGTVLAGTALVKNQAEWDALRGDPAQLLAVLGNIGIPTSAD